MILHWQDVTYDITFTEDVDGGVPPLVTVTGKSRLYTTCTCTFVCVHTV